MHRRVRASVKPASALESVSLAPAECRVTLYSPRKSHRRSACEWQDVEMTKERLVPSLKSHLCQAARRFLPVLCRSCTSSLRCRPAKPAYSWQSHVLSGIRQQEHTRPTHALYTKIQELTPSNTCPSHSAGVGSAVIVQKGAARHARSASLNKVDERRACVAPIWFT